MGSSEPVEETILGMTTIGIHQLPSRAEKPKWRLMKQCVNQLNRVSTERTDGHDGKLTMFFFRVYIFPT